MEGRKEMAAHLEHEGLGHRAQRVVGGDPEGAVDETVEVHRGSGEGHRRVQGQRQHVLGAGRVEDADPVAAAGVHDDLPGLPHARGGQTGDEVTEGVVWHGEQDELGAVDEAFETPAWAAMASMLTPV